MLENLAQVLVTGLTLYGAIGLGFSLVFVVFGVHKIDPAAVGGTWGFRVLIVPGTAALWPLLAWRWARGRQPPAESNAHRDATRERSEDAEA